MQKIVRGGIIISLFCVLAAFTNTSKESVGKITFPLNRVFVIPEGSADLKMAFFNMDVFPGDKIETKRESRCEISLKNGDVVRIDENSIYTLEEVQISEEKVQASSFLSVGKLWATIQKIFSEDDYVTVKSPTAVIAVRGTIYRLDVDKDSLTTVKVYDGEVEVSPAVPSTGMMTPGQPRPVGPPTDVAGPRDVAGPQDVSETQWLEIVKAQQQVVIRKDGTFRKSEFDAVQDAASDWVQWNKQRDQMLQR